MAIYYFLGLLCCLSAALALQCYSGSIINPATPGVTMPPVKLETCPPEAKKCANTETSAEVTVPNLSPIKTTVKVGQCAPEQICGGTFNCDKAKQITRGLKSCKTTCCSTDKCNGPNLDQANNGGTSGKGGSGNSSNSVKASFIGAFTTMLVAIVFIK